MWSVCEWMQTLSLFTSCLYVQWLCRRTISLLHVCYNKIYCRTWYCSGASDKYPQSPPANVYIYIKWVFCWCLFCVVFFSIASFWQSLLTGSLLHCQWLSVIQICFVKHTVLVCRAQCHCICFCPTAHSFKVVILILREKFQILKVAPSETTTLALNNMY